MRISRESGGGGSSRYEMYPEIADTWTGRKRELEGGSGGA